MIKAKESLQKLQELEDDWLLCRYSAEKNLNKIQSFHRWYDYAFSLFAKYFNNDLYFQDFSKVDLEGNIYVLNSEYNRISHIYQYFKNKLIEDVMIMNQDVKNIFISHSKDDEKVVGALVRLIQLSLGLSPTSIFCTSLTGYGIDTGGLINETIKKHIRSSRLMLSVLTQNSINSKYVLFEMGARWLIEKPLYAVVIDEKLDNYLFKPLDEVNYILLAKAEKTMELLENIARLLDVPLLSSSSIPYVEEFIQIVGRNIKK